MRVTEEKKISEKKTSDTTLEKLLFDEVDEKEVREAIKALSWDQVLQELALIIRMKRTVNKGYDVELRKGSGPDEYKVIKLEKTIL